MRVNDEMTVEHILPTVDPIKQQLLGGGQSANGVYDPGDRDVPLLDWLQQHAPEDAAWTKQTRPQSRPPAMDRGKNLGRQ